MNSKKRRPIWIAAGAVLTLAAAGTQTGRAQQPEAKTAEQVYKNITQLKGTPADQLIPAMQVMSSALGVNCEFCHVEGKREADDKQEKKRARDMIAMTMSINKEAFNGRQTVTCFSCHQGSEHPTSVAPVLQSDAMPRTETSSDAHSQPMDPAANTAEADQVIARYLDAVGGADALNKITGFIVKGSMTAGPNQTPVEIYEKAPNKRLTISQAQNGSAYTGFDGTSAWTGNTGRPARDLSAQDAWAASVQSDLILPLHLKELFPQVRAGRPEQVNGTECDVLIAMAPGKPPARLWFDAKTGLLSRMLLLADTPVGRLPTQIDFSDYRDVNGVKTPFRWTTAGTNRRSTVQVAELKTAEIEDARFTKPSDALK